MCAGPFKPSMPKPPSVSAADREAQASARRASRDALKEERRTAGQLKADQLEITTAALAGRRGRRSLLSGRKGGKGFDLQDEYKTKTTLGA
jgi:hypothetical protein